jgi:predicted ATPase
MLSFGELRAMLLITAIKAVRNDDTVILVDAFEAGLHYDWIVDIVDLLTKIPQPVILESHNAITLKAALTRGWSLYYILEGKSKPITSLRNMEIFSVETEAYVRASASN